MIFNCLSPKLAQHGIKSFFCMTLMLFLLSMSSLLTGCFGGGGGSSGGSLTDDSISGVVMDGYLRGAKVFWDCNDNLKIDTGEISTTSGEGGAYHIDVAPNSSCKLLANVPSTAIDEDTNQAVGGSVILAALPSNPKIITPLTTLVTVGKMTEAEVREKFKLPLSLEEDYIKAGVTGISQHGAAKVTMIGLQAVDGQIRNATETERNAIVGQSLLHVFNAGYDPNSGKTLTQAQIDAIKAAIPQRSSMPQLAPINFILNPKTTSSFSNVQKQLLEEALAAAKTYSVISGLTIRWSELPDTIRQDLGARAAQIMPVTPEIDNLRTQLRTAAEATNKEIEKARQKADNSMLEVVIKNTSSMTFNSINVWIKTFPLTRVAGKYKNIKTLKKFKDISDRINIRKFRNIKSFSQFMTCASSSLDTIQLVVDGLDENLSLDSLATASVKLVECTATSLGDKGELAALFLKIADSTRQLSTDERDFLVQLKPILDLNSFLADMIGLGMISTIYEGTIGTALDGYLAYLELNEVGDKAMSSLVEKTENISKKFAIESEKYRVLFFAARFDPYIMADIDPDFTYSPGAGTTNVKATFTPVVSDAVRKKGGGAIGYEWQFGDGVGLSTASEITHTYAKSGWYDVTFTVKSVAAGNPYSASITKKVLIGTASPSTKTVQVTFEDQQAKTMAARVGIAAVSAVTGEPGDCKVGGFNFGDVANTPGVIPYDVKIYNKASGRIRGGRSCLTDTSGKVNYDYGTDWFSNMETHGVDLVEHYLVITAGHSDKCERTTIRHDDITADFDLGEIALCTSKTTDTDADGIPDYWELANGLDFRNPADADQDKDGDGTTNLDEFKANTDPSRFIAPQNVRAIPSDGTVTLVWDSVPGATNYNVCHATESINEISSCTYATAGTWINSITATSVEIPLQNNVKYYFRIVAGNASGIKSPASAEVTAIPQKSLDVTTLFNTELSQFSDSDFPTYESAIFDGVGMTEKKYEWDGKAWIAGTNNANNHLVLTAAGWASVPKSSPSVVKASADLTQLLADVTDVNNAVVESYSMIPMHLNTSSLKMADILPENTWKTYLRDNAEIFPSGSNVYEMGTTSITPTYITNADNAINVGGKLATNLDELLISSIETDDKVFCYSADTPLFWRCVRLNGVAGDISGSVTVLRLPQAGGSLSEIGTATWARKTVNNVDMIEVNLPDSLRQIGRTPFFAYYNQNIVQGEFTPAGTQLSASYFMDTAAKTAVLQATSGKLPPPASVTGFTVQGFNNTIPVNQSVIIKVHITGLTRSAIIAIQDAECSAPYGYTLTYFYQECTPRSIGSKTLIVKDKAGGSVLYSSTVQVGQQSVPMSVHQIDFTEININEPVTITVHGFNVPSSAILALADAECEAPSNHVETGFTQVCVPRASGSKELIIKDYSGGNIVHNSIVLVP